MVPDTSEPQGELERLKRLGTLVNRYAQSRSLGLLIVLAILLINSVLLWQMDKLIAWRVERLLADTEIQQSEVEVRLEVEAWWVRTIVLFEVLFSIGAVWLIFRLGKRYGMRFYRRDGVIELRRGKTPLIACIVFFIVHTVPAALTMFEYISNRWGLALILTVAGAFFIYIRNKVKEVPICLVFGGLLLLEAGAVALGMPTPFRSREWDYSFCAAYLILGASAGLVTAVAVHIYNRRIWKRITQDRPFNE
jgi:biotin transporter BioY